MNSQIQSSLSWRRLDTLPTTSSSLLKIGIIEKRGHIYLKFPPSFPVWVNGRRVRGRTVITAGDILQVFKERWLLEDVDGKYVFNLQNLPPIAKGRVNIWFPLKERISLIGSGPECDILLPGLGVPEIAARLERKSDATWRLIPMGGKEDIQINKKSTENEQVLYFGDKISIGGYEFLYRGVGLLWSGENAPDGWHGTAVEVERGGRKILEKVSFEVFAGEVMVVIGRSGAGKTTLLRAALGLIPCAVSFASLSISEFRKRFPWRFGWLPQADVIFPNLRVRELLDFGSRSRLPKGLSLRDRAERMRLVAGEFDILNLMDQRVGDLSSGESRKVFLAVECLHAPDFLVLDEPTSNLDPLSEKEILKLLRRAADCGARVIFSSHSPLSLEIADRILALSEGRTVFEGSIEDAYEFFGAKNALEIFEQLEPKRSRELQVAFSLLHSGSSHLSARRRKIAKLFDEYSPTRLRKMLSIGREKLRIGCDFLTTLGIQVATFFGSLQNIILSLVNPIIIGVLLHWAIQGTPDDEALKLFLASLTILWLGASQGSQEIVPYWSYYLRERLAGLTPVKYVLAKWTFVSFIVFLQSVLLYVVLRGLSGRFEGEWFWQMGAIGMVGIFASALGLWVSAIARTSVQASVIVPFVLIPIVIFSGYPVSIGAMKEGVRWVAGITPLFQSQVLFDVSYYWGEEASGERLLSHYPAAQNLRSLGYLKNLEPLNDLSLPLGALARLWLWTFIILGIVPILLVRREWREHS